MTEVIFGVRVRTHKDEKDGVMLYNCLDVLRGIGSAERPSRVIRGLKLERDCVRLPKMGWWLTFHGVVRLMLKWDSRAKRVMMDVLWTMRHEEFDEAKVTRGEAEYWRNIPDPPASAALKEEDSPAAMGADAMLIESAPPLSKVAAEPLSRLEGTPCGAEQSNEGDLASKPPVPAPASITDSDSGALEANGEDDSEDLSKKVIVVSRQSRKRVGDPERARPPSKRQRAKE